MSFVRRLIPSWLIWKEKRMSKIEELIQEYCPDGVEYKPLPEVTEKLSGSPITAAKMKTLSVENGDITIFGGGSTIIKTDKSHAEQFKIITEPSVLCKSRGIIDFEYCDFPYTFKQEMWAYKAKDGISTKFLYYFLTTQIPLLRRKSEAMGSMPQIGNSDTNRIMIPVPPLPVQQEIVRILDTFTEMEESLKEELELRKKQYEYYRDMLLTFKRKEV